jgi:hypothetical protein
VSTVKSGVATCWATATAPTSPPTNIGEANTARTSPIDTQRRLWVLQVDVRNSVMLGLSPPAVQGFLVNVFRH